MLGLQHTGGLTAQVDWLGLKVGGQLALPCIRQMNRVNSRSLSRRQHYKHRPGIIIIIFFYYYLKPS